MLDTVAQKVIILLQYNYEAIDVFMSNKNQSIPDKETIFNEHAFHN